MSCQNETWNPGHDECKHKSRSETNFDGNSSAEKKKVFFNFIIGLESINGCLCTEVLMKHDVYNQIH